MDAYNYVIPNVIEKTNGVERAYDLYSKMLKDNIIFVGTPIDDGVANVVCAQLLHLESENPDKDINLYINSPGGDINALFAIYDTMHVHQAGREHGLLWVWPLRLLRCMLGRRRTPGKRSRASARSGHCMHQPLRWCTGSGRRIIEIAGPPHPAACK